MVKTLGTTILSFVVLVSIYSCNTSSSQEIRSQEIPWVEGNGQFIIKDISRAQNEIPFTLILPHYLEKLNSIYPDIHGPLREYQTDKVKIEISYAVNLEENINHIIFITEYNYPVYPSDPNLNDHIEYAEINGSEIVKTVDNLSPPTFHFVQDEIYVFVELLNFPFPVEEAIKIIESMIL